MITYWTYSQVDVHENPPNKQFIIDESESRVIATVHGNDGEENAALIASAPALKEEVEVMKYLYNDLCEQVGSGLKYDDVKSNIMEELRIRREREAILLERDALLDAMALTLDGLQYGTEMVKLVARHTELKRKQLPQIP